MQFKKSLSLLLCIGCIFLSSWAFADQDGDYTYTVSGDNATITAYTGTGGDISIPATLGGHQTVAIGDSSFVSKSNLTSVTIPSSVINIWNYAFAACTGLTSVTIPSSITSIGEGAFQSCSNLTSVTIPSSVTSIGFHVFTFCTSLTSITVDVNNPNFSSLDGVLYNKVGAKLIQCPAGKSGTFSIPPSVMSVGQTAFYSCSSLTSVFIPSSVTNIGEFAFMQCTSLISINVDASNPNYSSQDGVLYNKDKTTLIQYSGGKYGDYIIPNSVTSINDWSFYNCIGLTSVTIPSSVTSTGQYAFHRCTGLISVSIGSGVTSIGGFAFYGSTALTGAYFYGNAPTMGAQVFDNCASGFTVYYLEGATGFTNPWYGYPTAVFTPPSTTTTTQPTTTTTVVSTTTTIDSGTTTTTIPAETCELTVSPIRKISFLFFPIPLRIITLTALGDVTLSSGDTLDWGTEALRTLSVRVSPRKPGQARAIVLIRPLQLDSGTYDVMFGNCEGTLEIK